MRGGRTLEPNDQLPGIDSEVRIAPYGAQGLRAAVVVGRVAPVLGSGMGTKLVFLSASGLTRPAMRIADIAPGPRRGVRHADGQPSKPGGIFGRIFYGFIFKTIALQRFQAMIR